MRLLKREKIQYVINNYGIFVIALSICILFFISIHPYIAKVMESKNIDKVFQSTITCISILLGFSGTLITQLLNAKREYDKSSDRENETRFKWFFKTINPRTLTNIISVCIISGISLIIISLIMLIINVLTINIRVMLFYFWIYVFIIYVYYEVVIYRLFISLLFDNEEQKKPMVDSEDPKARQECIKAINNQNHR